MNESIGWGLFVVAVIYLLWCDYQRSKRYLKMHDEFQEQKQRVRRRLHDDS